MIEKYKISGLFGYRAVDIDFNSNVKILIGENGFGKTTVLNSLYYLLNCKYKKLLDVEFEFIEIKFSSIELITITRYELDEYVNYIERNKKRRRFPPSLEEKLSSIDLSYINGFKIVDNDVEMIIKKIISEHKIKRFAPYEIMISEIFRYVKEKYSETVFDQLEKIIKSLNYTLVYLPTYRRVEEDLNRLGNFETKDLSNKSAHGYYDEYIDNTEINKETLIHFGMEDVRERIIKIEQEIEKSTIFGFSNLTGEMLSQLLKGFPAIQNDYVDNLDTDTAKIILHRVDESLLNEDRENILKLLDSKESLKEKKELVFFISKLIDIYNEHKYLDDSLKKFKDVCNKYLVDKEFRYYESSIDLDIFRVNTEERVELNKLSSGEKQIISIFSKIYLEKSDNLIVLFDEPELSLSLPWQKQLLPHIMDSNKCKFLLSVTHSPFIFDNELEKYAVGINIYMDDIND